MQVSTGLISRRQGYSICRRRGGYRGIQKIDINRDRDIAYALREGKEMHTVM
jgi:hypothetical protein